MSDQEDSGEVVLDSQEAEAIIEWAVRAGALVILLREASLVRDAGGEPPDFSEAVDLLCREIPEPMADAALYVARGSVEDALTVDEFRRELSEWPNVEGGDRS